MRSDMFEVIIERPRRQGWGRPKGRRGERLRRLEAPLREPMSIRRGNKVLNENLAPLYRFLLRNVGRPWDAVRSEICAHVAPRSAVQKHVLDHVEQMVAEHVVMIDGRPHLPAAWGPRRDQYLEIGWHRWRPFYVCPATRVLRVLARTRERRGPRA